MTRPQQETEPCIHAPAGIHINTPAPQTLTEAVSAAQAAVGKTLRRDWNVTGNIVFQRPGRRDPRTALVDMLLLGMSNETGTQRP